MSAALAELVDAGRAISDAAFRDALAQQEQLRRAFASRMRGYDALLTIPATGGAPRGLGWTGDARFCVPWTTLGVPAISLPIGLSPAGLPLGLQAVGRFGDDAGLLGAAVAMSNALPAIGAPPLFAS